MYTYIHIHTILHIQIDIIDKWMTMCIYIYTQSFIYLYFLFVYIYIHIQVNINMTMEIVYIYIYTHTHTHFTWISDEWSWIIINMRELIRYSHDNPNKLLWTLRKSPILHRGFRLFGTAPGLFRHGRERRLWPLQELPDFTVKDEDGWGWMGIWPKKIGIYGDLVIITRWCPIVS